MSIALSEHRRIANKNNAKIEGVETAEGKEVVRWNTRKHLRKYSNRGRPSKLTPAVVRELVRSFKIGFNVTEACEAAEISRESFYKYMREDEVFSDKITRSQNDLVFKAHKVIADGIYKKKDWRLALKLLIVRDPEHYSPRYIMKFGKKCECGNYLGE